MASITLFYPAAIAWGSDVDKKIVPQLRVSLLFRAKTADLSYHLPLGEADDFRYSFTIRSRFRPTLERLRHDEYPIG
jgi:hypothetical protein